jgi:outer membrane lipoprotein SlyB
VGAGAEAAAVVGAVAGAEAEAGARTTHHAVTRHKDARFSIRYARQHGGPAVAG